MNEQVVILERDSYPSNLRMIDSAHGHSRSSLHPCVFGILFFPTLTLLSGTERASRGGLIPDRISLTANGSNHQRN